MTGPHAVSRMLPTAEGVHGELLPTARRAAATSAGPGAERRFRPTWGFRHTGPTLSATV